MPDVAELPVILDRGLCWVTLRCLCGQYLMVAAADERVGCRRCGRAWRYVWATVEAV